MQRFSALVAAAARLARCRRPPREGKEAHRPPASSCRRRCRPAGHAGAAQRLESAGRAEASHPAGMLHRTPPPLALPGPNELTVCGHHLRARVQGARLEHVRLVAISATVNERRHTRSRLVLFEFSMDFAAIWRVLERAASARSMVASARGDISHVWREWPRGEREL